MTDDRQKAEEMLQQSKSQSRHTSEPTVNDEPDDTPDRTTAIKDALIAIDQNETPENINIRDKHLKALLIGIEETGELVEIIETLEKHLDTEVDASEPTQSDAARLLIRAGLKELMSELLEDGKEARREALLEQANDF